MAEQQRSSGWNLEEMQERWRETAEQLARPWQEMAEAFSRPWQEMAESFSSGAGGGGAGGFDLESIQQNAADAFNGWLEQQQQIMEMVQESLRPFAEQAQQAAEAFMENMRSFYGGGSSSRGSSSSR